MPASPGGLLDPSSFDPRQDMVLSVAGQLLNNAGPSATRQSLLQGIPQAIQQARQTSAQRQIQAQQFQALKSKADQDQKAALARELLARQMKQRAGYNAGAQAMPEGGNPKAQDSFLNSMKPPTQDDLMATFLDAFPDQAGAVMGKQLMGDEPKYGDVFDPIKNIYTYGKLTPGAVTKPGPTEKAGSGGPFQGTGLDAQVMNILLQGDPAAPEYLAAYNHAAQPRQSLDPTTGLATTYTPDMSAYRRPKGGGPNAVPVFGAPASVTTQQVTKPKLTTSQENDMGSIRAQRATIQGAIDAVNKLPGAFGITKGLESKIPMVSGKVLGPEAVTARSLVLNNVSSIITERAGAAQSAQELKRIEGFLPTTTDDAPTILAKLKAFNAYLDERENGIKGTTDGGFKLLSVTP